MSASDAGLKEVEMRDRISNFGLCESSPWTHSLLSVCSALITLTFLQIVLAVFRSESYIVKAQDTAQPPTGHYQCREWERQPTILLAVVVLHGDGTYEATDRMKDLQANRPTTTGRYTYDESKQQIDWTSGHWRNRLGLYMPKVKGTDFIVIHTKRDPEGKLDGTMRCARTPSLQ